MEKEIITSIEEVFDLKIMAKHSFEQSFDGWIIKTTKRTIQILVNSDQCCCEDWGSIVSEDNVKYFIGSELLSIESVDKACNSKNMENIEVYEGSIMFLNVNTDKGLLQFAVYNAHNGYYGHYAFIKTIQNEDNKETIIKEETL